MTDIILDENIVRRIVRAIDKAVADDVPQYLREHHLETNNAIIHLRGDYINENLRNLVVCEGVELIQFKRYVWQGRLLADRRNKITYSITTQKTLQAIPRKKDRARPHFLMSVLATENKDYQGLFGQQTLFLMDIFDDETLQNDYDEIIAGMLDPSEGYRHYIIAYEATGDELVDVKLEFLDRNFALVAEASLTEYIKPDFARLTNAEPIVTETPEAPAHTVRGLIGIKAGIRPQLREVEQEA